MRFSLRLARAARTPPAPGNASKARTTVANNSSKFNFVAMTYVVGNRLMKLCTVMFIKYVCQSKLLSKPFLSNFDNKRRGFEFWLIRLGSSSKFGRKEDEFCRVAMANFFFLPFRTFETTDDGERRTKERKERSRQKRHRCLGKLKFSTELT